MANFQAGSYYTNQNGSYYATKKNLQPLAQQSSNEPALKWFCKSVSRVFAVFLDETNVVQRRKIYRDSLGSLVFPKGRFEGAHILRA